MIVIVFGASGDLAKRKIFPSLLNCRTKPQQIIGYGRQDLRTSFHQVLQDFHRYPVDFLEIVEYVRGEYTDLSLLHKYKNDEILFYFSVPPSIYEILLSEISSSFQRGFVALEKPFASEKYELAQIDIFSRENPGFRPLLVDHYLLKPLIAVLPILKASRPIDTVLKFESIKAIYVVSKEQLGIEGRGYFDQTGIIKDIIQNHLLSFFASVFARIDPHENQKAFSRIFEAAKKIKSAILDESGFRSVIYEDTSEGPSFPSQSNLQKARENIESKKLALSLQKNDLKPISSANSNENTASKATDPQNTSCNHSKHSTNSYNEQQICKNDIAGSLQDAKMPESLQIDHKTASTAPAVPNLDGKLTAINVDENLNKSLNDKLLNIVKGKGNEFDCEFFQKLANARFQAIKDLDIKKQYAVFGQYEGYETELGKASNTETYSAIVLKNAHKTPIVFTGGKGLDSKLTELKVIYKPSAFKGVIESLLPTESKESQFVKISNIESVELVFNVHPLCSVFLNIRMKHKCKKYEIFSKEIITNIYKSIYGDQIDHALIFEYILTRKSIPLTALDEAKYQWAIFDFEILKSKRGLFKYQKGIDIPQQASELLVSIDLPDLVAY